MYIGVNFVPVMETPFMPSMYIAKRAEPEYYSESTVDRPARDY